MTAAAVVATSTAAAGWRGSGRGGRGVVEAVVQPLGWRGLPCRRRGGRRCGVAVGNTELAGGDSRCWWLQAATADGGRLVAMNVATVDVAVAEEVRMATASIFLGIILFLSMAAPAERRSEPDWSSGLPRKLLEFIAKKLPSGRDAASFRLVCSPWCAALPLETFYPMLMLPFDPDSPDGDAAVVTFYCAMDDDDEATIDLRLPEVRGKVACGMSHGWLALMDGAAAVTLLNPFTGAAVALPPADRNVAMASYKTVSMVDGAWILHYISGATKPIKLSNMRDVFFREIVLSASPRNSRGVDCMAMAVLASSTLVAFCRLGDARWTLVDSKLEYPVTCVVHCRDRFVAIGSLGEISIFSVDNTDGVAPLTASLLLLMPPPAHICQRSYMDINGELYLVGAILRVTTWTRYEIVVYKCNLLDENPLWSKVEDSEDIAFFVSKYFNTGFGVASTSNIRWSCVYLSEPRFCTHEDQKCTVDSYLEMVDINTNESALQAYRPSIQGLGALCWIRPNLWS
ncbi:hypothetical protein OsJ_13786 [Oryza sativa Japonica Group]|uniref:KIB1-4 beta-propeller domain-containing protein n=1 Tax=Oryza sativa subsp. japonica TaxID=39947 RepID=B9FDM5_ORYSJ|nr:hypothetical protein OsJ_13786 [Oryza sativa Japonica Group]